MPASYLMSTGIAEVQAGFQYTATRGFGGASENTLVSTVILKFAWK